MSAHYCARCLTTFEGDPGQCTNLGCGGSRPGTGWGLVLEPGDELDRHYRILKILAVGGAGLTYLAREIDHTGEPVAPDLAIKVLYAARDSGPFLRRLSNEAQILQELDHRNIVECRGFVQRAGHAPYLVTLFEHGGGLQQHIERVGPVSCAVAAAILKQVLDALDIAHQRAVVHRDLKPDNVLLHEAVPANVVPQIKVTDFGIAKVFGGVGERLTRLGAFVGTPEYAAPEQFEGLTPTPATDVFAAGGLLVHLLTGQPPVQFAQRFDIEHSYEELLAELPPKLPDSIGPAEHRAVLQRVLDHVMTAEPGERWTIQKILATIAPIAAPAPVATLSDRPATRLDKAPTATLPPSEDGSRPAAERRRAAAERPASNLTPATSPPPARGPGALVGVAGVAALLLGASVLGVVVLLGAAWGLGWFAPTSAAADPVLVDLDPLVVRSTEPVVLTGATDPIRQAEGKRIRDAVAASSGDLRILCRHDGRVTVEVVVEADGRVREATFDPRTVTGEPAACLAAAIGRLTLPRTMDAPVKLRFELDL